MPSLVIFFFFLMSARTNDALILCISWRSVIKDYLLSLSYPCGCRFFLYSTYFSPLLLLFFLDTTLGPFIPPLMFTRLQAPEVPSAILQEQAVLMNLASFYFKISETII